MLETIGYRAEMGRWATAADASVGRVVRVDGGLVSVVTDTGLGHLGACRASVGGGLLGRMAKESAEGPCTGDWCVLRSWPDHRVTVERLLPRRTAVVHAVAGERSLGRLLCANVDVVALVVALHPPPALSGVERLVALAWESGARPLVVLTKSDLVTDAHPVAEDVAGAAPGVEVVVVSARSGAGIDGLRSRLQGGLTMALLGASGHGKSSLANAMVGAGVLGTRAFRADGRGRHTSVPRELVPVPGGGAVIDTPGLRKVGLIDAGSRSAQQARDRQQVADRTPVATHDQGAPLGCELRTHAEQGVDARGLQAGDARHVDDHVSWGHVLGHPVETVREMTDGAGIEVAGQEHLDGVVAALTHVESEVGQQGRIVVRRDGW